MNNPRLAFFAYAYNLAELEPLPISRAVVNILGLSYFHLLGGPTNRLKAGSEKLPVEIKQRINLRKVSKNSLIIGVSYKCTCLTQITPRC